MTHVYQSTSACLLIRHAELGAKGDESIDSMTEV